MNVGRHRFWFIVLVMARPTSVSGVNCSHCGSGRVVGGGTHYTGKQRFICRGCGRTFVDPAARAVREPVPSEGHLILKLRSAAESLGRTPTREQARVMGQAGRMPRVEHYLRAFGGWQAALRRARLPTYFDREFGDVERKQMLDRLRELSRRLRRPIVGDDVRQARKQRLVPPLCRYDRAFGSVPNAIAAAGVAPKNYYTTDEIISIFRKLDLTLDRPVEEQDLREMNRQGRGPAPNTVIKRFGGLRAARAAAGTREHYRNAAGLTKNRHRYTRVQLIAQLRELAGRLGRKPTFEDVKEGSRRGECATTQTLYHHFGSVVEAFRAAGFLTRPAHYTDKEIIAALRRLKLKLGRFPTVAEINAAHSTGDCPTQETVRRRLGNLSELREWV